MYTRQITVVPESGRYEDIEIDVNEALLKLAKEEGQEPQSITVLNNYCGSFGLGGSRTLMVVFGGNDLRPRQRHSRPNFFPGE